MHFNTYFHQKTIIHVFEHIFHIKKNFDKIIESPPLKMNFIIFPYFHQKTIIHAFEHIFHNKKNFYRNRDSTPHPPENEFNLSSIILPKDYNSCIWTHFPHPKELLEKSSHPPLKKNFIIFPYFHQTTIINALMHITTIKNKQRINNAFKTCYMK